MYFAFFAGCHARIPRLGPHPLLDAERGPGQRGGRGAAEGGPQQVTTSR